MVNTNKIQQLDSETLRDLQEMRDTRQEVLIELGREEGQLSARLEIAKRMLKEGISIDKIAMLTNLSPSEIQKLQ